MKKYLWFFISLAVFFSAYANALGGSFFASGIDLRPYMHSLEDPEARLSIRRIREENAALAFKPLLNPGLIRNNVSTIFWVKIDLSKIEFLDKDTEYFLYIPFSPIKEIQYFWPGKRGLYQQKSIGLDSEGDQDGGKSAYYKIKIDTDRARRGAPVYFRIDNLGRLYGNSFHVYLYKKNEVSKRSYELQAMGAAAYSILIALFIFNILVFSITKKIFYLSYILYLATVFVVCSFSDGYFYRGFGRLLEGADDRLFYIALIVQALTHMYFVLRIIFGGFFHPLAERLFRYYFIFGLALIFNSIFVPISIRYQVVCISLFFVISSSLMLFIIYAIIKKYPYSKPLFLGEIFLHACIFLYILQACGYLNDSVFSPWFLHAGYIAEAFVLLVVFALRYRFFEFKAIEAETNEQHAMEVAEKAKAETDEKTKFLARASHDLRQPLHALSLQQAVLEFKNKDPDQKGIISDIRLSVNSMREMFDDILDLSRLELGVIEPVIENFCLEDIFVPIRNEFEILAQGKGLTFSVRPQKKLFLRSDKKILARILRNLFANALRYTERGGVLVGCKKRGDRVRIDVVDTGIGILNEDKYKIFSEYTQLGEEQNTGLGMGLAIVKKFSQMLNCEVEVNSVAGKGSRFSVLVPLANDVDLPSEKVEKQVSAEKNIVGLVVVIIDDDALIRNSLSEYLESCGCSVISGYFAEDIVNQLERSETIPDIILADFFITETVSGLDVASEVKKHFFDESIPVVVITGGDASVELKALAMGAGFVLRKPVDPAELVNKISAAFKK